MPTNVFLANGGVTTPPAAPPPPAAPVAPPPPAPASALPAGTSLADVDAAAAAAASSAAALLAGAGLPSNSVLFPAAPPPPAAGPAALPPGVTLSDVNAAAAAAAAGAAVLLAGGGSAEIAAAEAAAGAPQSVLDAIAAADVPNIANIDLSPPSGSGGDVGGTGDLAASAAVAAANKPDLSNLPPFELDDPFGIRTLASTNPTLKGGGALSAIAQACSDYGVDTLAAVANALHEGANGAIGDGGLAYGPFQDHLTEFADRPFYGKGRGNEIVNAWAWSENGIRYAVRSMVNGSPSAKGLRGHPAVYAIVYGFERPGDEAGAYRLRSAEYDTLISKGSQWAVYAAPKFLGPSAGGGVDTVPIVPASSSAYRPSHVLSQWRGFVDVFRTAIPKERHRVSSVASSLKEVFR